MGVGERRVRREAEAAAEGADLRTNIAGAEGEGDEAAGGAPEPYSVLPGAEEAEAGGQPALVWWWSAVAGWRGRTPYTVEQAWGSLTQLEAR